MFALVVQGSILASPCYASTSVGTHCSVPGVDIRHMCAAAGGLHGDSCGAVLACNHDGHDLVAQQDSSHTLAHLLCIRFCLER